MKVLYISDGSDKYGAPRALIELLKEIKEKKEIIPIVITSEYNSINQYCYENNIENYVFRYYGYMMTKNEKKFNFIVKYIIKYLRYKIFNRIAVKNIEKTIDLHKIEIIHTNTSIIDIGAILANKYKIKHFWHIREFGQEDYDMISFKKKYIEYINNNSHKIIAISEAIKDSWVKKGINQNKIKVLYDGIDLTNIVVKDNYNNNSNEIKMIIMGYISESKGQIKAIQAIQMLDKKDRKKVSLDIIGDGKKEYVEYLKKYVLDNNLEGRINFLGYRNDVRKILPQYDIGLMCSKSEGFGRTTVEYMATGLITIASNTGANLEIINNNQDGFIFQYDNIEELKNKISFILNNYSKFLNFSKNAKEKIRKKFNIKNFANNLIKEYIDSEE